MVLLPTENILIGNKLQTTERPTKQEVQRRTAPKVHDGDDDDDDDGDGDDKDDDSRLTEWMKLW